MTGTLWRLGGLLGPCDRRGRRLDGGSPAGSAQQMAEAVHVDVNDRGGEQCQQLGHQQAADDRIAERLTDLRADAVAEHQRDAAEQRAHRVDSILYDAFGQRVTARIYTRLNQYFVIVEV